MGKMQMGMGMEMEISELHPPPAPCEPPGVPGGHHRLMALQTSQKATGWVFLSLSTPVSVQIHTSTKPSERLGRGLRHPGCWARAGTGAGHLAMVTAVTQGTPRGWPWHGPAELGVINRGVRQLTF